VQARLSGQLAVSEGEVTGRIEIAGGKLDVQGKRFEIENGIVTFDGDDTANPTIAATARWDSPTGHSVYARYVGDVETGRIKLSSEPPLSHDQIASLLLFGTPDGTIGAGETDQASLAVSAAGGTVAQGLNQALTEFTELDVQARVDTSTGNARPELVFQVSPRVATKVSRALGEPTVGEAPDRTFVTLELRLKRSWALSAVLGDHGASALDLIWRRRY
jgi:translocation and assembly module TamB